MKKTILLAGLLALPAVGSASSATIDLRLNLPVVVPQPVVVSPGVQVVPEVDEEVFFVDGYYWCRRDGHWYRSRAVRNGWVAMQPRAVPARLVKIPPGHYRHWKAERKAEKAALKEERREERHEDHGHDRGHHDR